MRAPRRAGRMFRLRARRDGTVAAHTDGRFNGTDGR